MSDDAAASSAEAVQEGGPTEAAPGGQPPSAAPDQGPLASFKDESLRDYAVGKGFDKSGLEGAVRSYQHLERMVRGGNADSLVALPGMDADESAWGELYNKLGRPQQPEGYKLPVPEGADDGLAKWAAPVFHKHGLTAKQAEGLAADWNEFISAQQQSATQQLEQTYQAADAELQREWGQAFERKMKGAELAAKRLGIDENVKAALAQGLGPAAAVKFLDQLAGKLGEDTMELGETGDPSAMTPAQAKDQLTRLMADPSFQKAMSPSASKAEREAAMSRRRQITQWM